MARIFKTPFGAQGDTEQVPEAPQGDGSVSLTQGFGYDYEREYEDPAAKDIRREVMNGLFHDITGAIGDIQLTGIAKWSEEAAPYPAGAVVWRSGVAWMSTTGNNNSVPGEGGWEAVDLSSSIRLSEPIDQAPSANNVQEALAALGEYVDAAGYLQPSITGSCTTNGTTDNALVLTGIVSSLALEAGDVIQITGSTGGLNDKLFTVESITNDNSIILNYEHAGNRGNGSLKLADQSATVTIKRISKWYNAPIGLGQAWVNVTSLRVFGSNYTNSTNRALVISVTGRDNTDGGNYSVYVQVDGLEVAGARNIASHSSAQGQLSVLAPVPLDAIYAAYTAAQESLNVWAELR